MIKAIMNGCGGRMGKMIFSVADSDPEINIVAGVDKVNVQNMSIPVFGDISHCSVPADVVIDFSLPDATDVLLDYCVEKKLPLVLCTTGLSAEQVQRVEKASEVIPVLRSANMSIGINLLMKVLKETAGTLAAAGFDIEIVEKHHNKKKDAPSGTAIALADTMLEVLPGDYSTVYDRSGRNESRPSHEIGISAVRGGTIPGDHDVIFAGEDEVITFSHRAYSRAIFAKGAIAAAKFLAGKAPGMYSMSDVLN
ncbi:MAG: 4-hydroxy-tetrahydrodipicolinate reductase [Lachnospiraceae bacterium]|nr:4-hydroxy-tetrahydrodipicolinate reductase [Lachnospiraceae bacterium]